MGQGHHFELLLDAHAGLFEHLPEMTIHDAVGGEVVDAAETHGLDLTEPVPHPTAGVGGMNSADDGDFLHHREHLIFANLHGDGIGVSVGHQATGRAVSAHPESTGVVDDNQVGPAFFDEFGADASTSSGSNNRLAAAQGLMKPFDDFFAGVRVSFSGPRIGHRSVFESILHRSVAER